MTEIISVIFKENGRAYSFDPAGIKAEQGEYVIVETQNGTEIGTVSAANHEVAKDAIVKPLKKVIRKATEKDMARREDNKRKEKALYFFTFSLFSIKFYYYISKYYNKYYNYKHLILIKYC